MLPDLASCATSYAFDERSLPGLNANKKSGCSCDDDASCAITDDAKACTYVSSCHPVQVPRRTGLATLSRNNCHFPSQSNSSLASRRRKSAYRPAFSTAPTSLPAHFMLATLLTCSVLSLGAAAIQFGFQAPFQKYARVDKYGNEVTFLQSGGLEVAVSVAITEAPDKTGQPGQFVTRAVAMQQSTINQHLAAADLERRNSSYRISRDSDPRRRFMIGPKDGVVRVNHPIDREECPTCDQYVLKVEIEDEFKQTVSHMTVQVVVNDLNDNAPSLNPDQIRIPENRPPGYSFTITGTDPDTPANGPPFKFQAAGGAEIQRLFSIQPDPTLDGGNGGFIIRSKVQFDRERQAHYEVPIWVSDSGSPPMTATRILMVVIGDENDNPMSDGRKEVQVYSYEGQLQRSRLGVVYVEDLDDLDMLNKTFEWSSGGKPAYFDLDRRSGEVFVEASAPAGKYSFDVLVIDPQRNERAIGTVAVTIEHVSDEAFRNAGSVRIRGTPADIFVRKVNGVSQYDRFRKKLAEFAKVAEANVKIFSVVALPSAPPIVDIRFAISASPYKAPETLHALIDMHRGEIEEFVGIRLIQVGINECLLEYCDRGCTNRAMVGLNASVIDAKASSLVGLYIWSEADCGSCAVQTVPRSCDKSTCFNGQPCHDVPNGGGFMCECRDDFLSGGRCEGTTRSFTGQAAALFKPIGQCDSGHISLKFATSEQNGLLLYNGPLNIDKISDYETKDYIAVYLNNGVPTIQIELGDGHKTVQFSSEAVRLSDGKWHTLDIYLDGTLIDLMVDNCEFVSIQEQPGGTGNSVGNFNRCKNQFRLPGSNEFLTVNGPLQLGGLAKTKDTLYPSFSPGATTGFIGCIRELRINGELYDLFSPIYDINSTPGCSLAHESCFGPNFGPLGKRCVHGECIGDIHDATAGKCICEPGYYGERCDKKSTWVEFGSGSFQRYSHEPRMVRDNAADVRVLIIPAAHMNNATLVLAEGFQREFSRIQLQNQHAKFDFDAGSGVRGPPELTLLNITAPQPYFVRAERVNEFSRVTVDKLYVSEDFPFRPPVISSDHKKVSMRNDGLILGASTDIPSLQFDDFQGCMSGFMWDSNMIPLQQSELLNLTSSYIRISKSANVNQGCSLLRTCAQLSCVSPFVCVDFWKGPFCTCPPGAVGLVDNGKLIACDQQRAAKAALLGMTPGAVAAILVSLVVLMLLVLLLVVYSRRRRPGGVYISPDDEARDRIVNYLEEGGGEEDQSNYDISRLRKPVLPMEGDTPMRTPIRPEPGQPRRRDAPLEIDTGDFIDDRLLEADFDSGAPPFDEIRPYVDEGLGLTPVGSLSSLGSGTDSDVDWDQTLPVWGPRFQRLADMYGEHEHD